MNTQSFSQDVSGLRFISIGVAAENKKMSSDTLEIFPSEINVFGSGEVTPYKYDNKANAPNIEGGNTNVQVTSTQTVRAKWLPMGNTNRFTAPDIRSGERVALYKYYDSDEYWWVTLQQDKQLRRKETVQYVYDNNPENNDVKTDSKNSYWMEVSTHKKEITLHTSKNDNEPFEYDVQIDTKNGVVTIKDDDGNFIVLRSKERQIKLCNKDNSYIDIDKKEIKINALDRVLITTKKVEIKANNEYDLTTKSYKTSASSRHDTQTPTATYSSNISAGSNIRAGANMSAGGTVSSSHQSSGTASHHHV